MNDNWLPLVQSIYAQSYSSYPSSSADVEPVVILIILAVVLLIGFAIQALICFLVWHPYKKVPEQHRIMSPGLVWLMMIPGFNLVWVFFVAIRISNSFKAYFNSLGDQSVGDAGKGVGLAWAICWAASIIPYIGACISVGGLVCVIIFAVKLYSMAGRIPQATSGPAAYD